jgi:membrane-bound lytic murein transglycosylase B
LRSGKFLLLIGALFFVTPVFAGNPPKFDEWLVSFRERASRTIPAADVDRALAGIRFIPAIVDLDRRQPEFMRSFWRYYTSAVTPTRITRGREIMRTHAGLLEKIGRKYGVQPHIIVAFWGMETNFGTFMGTHRTVDALATLAFDPRRSAFFTEQLLSALRIIAQGHKDPSARGSWAGAFGHFQFMPQTFERFAVDFDGDGKIDLYNSLPDAFASAANYLSSMGWKEKERWGRPVRMSRETGEIWALVNSYEKRTVAQFAALGITAYDGSPLPNSNIDAMLIAPNGVAAPMFLIYDNFALIMRWNAAQSYAISVGMLADEIVGRGTTLTRPEGDDEQPLSFDDVRAVQRRLQGLGLYDGNIDGRVGRQTVRGIKAYQTLMLSGDRRVSPDGSRILTYPSGRPVVPDGWPNRDLLAVM